MVLRAAIRHISEGPIHGLGTIGPNGPELSAAFNKASHVEIASDESGVFLIRYDVDGTFCGDTWHLTIEDAQQQARDEFGIRSEDWFRSE